MQRIDGWEGRFWDTIHGAEGKPYVLGEHDCFKLTCDVVKALTGVDLWSPWKGRYSTERQALKLIAQYGGSFNGAFTKLFNTSVVDPSMARRGDVLRFDDDNGTPHLGVCVGSTVCLLAEKGLTRVERADCIACWRIG